MQLEIWRSSEKLSAFVATTCWLPSAIAWDSREEDSNPLGSGSLFSSWRYRSRAMLEFSSCTQPVNYYSKEFNFPSSTDNCILLMRASEIILTTKFFQSMIWRGGRFNCNSTSVLFICNSTSTCTSSQQFVVVTYTVLIWPVCLFLHLPPSFPPSRWADRTVPRY